MNKITTLCSAAALMMSVGAASAATYDFIGPAHPLNGTNVGTSASFMDTTATSSVTAIAINTEQPPTPLLNWNQFGLGVDSDGGPLQNQLENVGDDEAIVFDFGGLTIFDSISLTLASAFDNFRIYGSNDSSVASCTTGGLICLTGVSDLLASGTGTGLGGGADVSLAGSPSYRYLIATTPPSGQGVGGYRIDQVVASPVPLPAAGFLMIAGLGGLAALRRRRKA